MQKALFAVAAAALLAAPAGAQDMSKFDPWTSWNALKEGSSVTFEMETAGMKMTTNKVLHKKGEEEHVLKTETIMMAGGQEIKTPAEEKVAKPKGGATDGECALCKKKYSEHKDMGKWSEETLKIGDKEVKCAKYESPAKMCNGQDATTSTSWFSSEVPGCLVKMEMAQMKMTLVKFEAKK
jgi:hypothetical protein